MSTNRLFDSMMIMFMIYCSYTLSLNIHTKNNLKKGDKTDRFISSAEYATKCMKGLSDSMPPGFCWKKGGDAGIIPSGCPAGYFRSMALCFEYCPDGWSHILGICYKNCESGYTDHGLSCFKHLFDFYFKQSYIPRSLTNFADNIPCSDGMYKSGALCYRDCSNIGMENCGIGACITPGASCTEEILKIVMAVEEGLNTALYTILTMGASNAPKAAAKVATKTAVKATSKSILKAGLKSVLNVLKGPFKKFTLKKAQEKVKEFFKDQIIDKVTEVTISTVCGTIYNSISNKQYTPPSDDEIGNKIIESVDIFGIKDIVEGCQDTSDGGIACAKSVTESLSTFDPTGVLSIAAAFMHPSCDVTSVKPADTEFADFEGDSTVANQVLAEKTERLKFVTLNTPSKCIWIFDQVNFEGNKLETCDSKDLAGTDFDNKVASFSVGSKLNGYFYEGSNYTGRFLKFTNNTKVDNISKFTYGTLNLKDAISSIYFGNDDKATQDAALAKLLQVKTDRFDNAKLNTPANCIWVYDQVDLLGNKFEICQSTDLSQTTWNDKIISLSIGSNVNGFLYEGPNFTGRFVKFLKSSVVDNLGKLSSNVSLKNVISSVYFGDVDFATKLTREIQAITPAKCILVFDQINFQGNKLEICQTTDLTGTAFNDKIFSFSAGVEANGFFYESQYFGGRNLKFSNLTANLDLGDFKNIITHVWFGVEDYLTIKKRELTANTPPKCIWIFDQINYQGNKLQLCDSKDLVGTAFDNKVISFSIGSQVDTYFFDGGKFMGNFIKFTRSFMLENVLTYTWNYITLKGVSSIRFGNEDIIQIMRSDTYFYNYFLTDENDYKIEFTMPTTKFNVYYVRAFKFSSNNIYCIYREVKEPISTTVTYTTSFPTFNKNFVRPWLTRCYQNPPKTKK